MTELLNGHDLAFNCQCCGRCCEGSGGIILSAKDLKRLCAHLELSVKEFEKKWAEKVNGKLRLLSEEGGGCIFYKPDIGCTVHIAKPDICRAWPYFRGNLIDELSLEMAKDYCPGIPHDIDFTNFVLDGLTYLKKNDLMSEKKSDEANALYVKDIYGEYFPE